MEPWTQISCVCFNQRPSMVTTTNNNRDDTARRHLATKPQSCPMVHWICACVWSRSRVVVVVTGQDSVLSIRSSRPREWRACCEPLTGWLTGCHSRQSTSSMINQQANEDNHTTTSISSKLNGNVHTINLNPHTTNKTNKRKPFCSSSSSSDQLTKWIAILITIRVSVLISGFFPFSVNWNSNSNTHTQILLQSRVCLVSDWIDHGEDELEWNKLLNEPVHYANKLDLAEKICFHLAKQSDCSEKVQH